MRNKTNRQISIKEIIASNKISKQEGLLNILHEKGFDITQATLSRDLKELNAGTKYDLEFGHIYYFPEDIEITENSQPSELNNITSLEISKNIAVLKTKSGFANSVAVYVESKNIKSIIGTVAGNDTILIIIDEKIKKKEFIDSLNKEFTNIIKFLKP